MATVGIVGLKPRQIPTLMAHADQHAASLKVYMDEHITKASLEKFARQSDVVLCLTNHVPSTVSGWMVSNGCHYLPGNVGVSAVQRWLEEKFPTQKAEEQLVVKPARLGPTVHTSDAQESASEPTAGEPNSEGYFGAISYGDIRYRFGMDVEFVELHANGKKDFRLLQAAEVGDTLGFQRLSSTAPSESEINSVRYALKHYGKLTGYQMEGHFTKNHLMIHVTGRKWDKDATMRYLSDVQTRQTVFSDPREPSEVEVVNPTAENVVSQSTHLTEEEVSFWKQVMLALISDGESVDSASKLARDSVLELRKLYSQGL